MTLGCHFGVFMGLAVFCHFLSCPCQVAIPAPCWCLRMRQGRLCDGGRRHAGMPAYLASAPTIGTPVFNMKMTDLLILDVPIPDAPMLKAPMLNVPAAEAPMLRSPWLRSSWLRISCRGCRW